MRVALLSSEAVPFAKTGGLGDVAGALPKALMETGVDVALVLPLYEATNRELLGGVAFDDLHVEWLGGIRVVRVLFSEAAGAPAFLIDAPEYFARPGFYGYVDDHERYAFFCQAALALMRRLGAPPDIVHGNDWFCGFAAVSLRTRRNSDSFYSGTRTLFSIHNLAYQGTFDSYQLGRLGFWSDEERNAFLHDGAASPMKAGIATSDVISTVSRRYALEIQTPEQGAGLDWLLRQRADRLVGITNGIDYDVWNPATDPHIAAHYDVNSLEGKRLCKLDLLRALGLPEDLDRPVIGSISRLTYQKGFDLVRRAANSILETGAFIVSLGSGDREYEDFFQALRDYAPGQVGIYRGYNESLAHKIEAGADIFLMPSLFEPCGLNQMYSMRYGTVPVVRATGGLDDTVEAFNRARGTGTGFKFYAYTPEAMTDAIYEALFNYADKQTWQRIQTNGMRVDNSWRHVAGRYAELYRATSAM